MNRQAFLSDLQARLMDLMRASPAADLERNLRAMLGQTFQRLELVTREEFDLQRELLARARAQLDELEARIAQIERTRSGVTGTAGATGVGAASPPVGAAAASATGVDSAGRDPSGLGLPD